MAMTVACINMKGGVGKTTLAVNLAYGLAYLHKKKVLLVDIDPQFNASTYLMSDEDYIAHIGSSKKKLVLDIFLPNKPSRVSTVKALSKSKPKPKPHRISLDSCIHNVYDGLGRLDLIPSTLDLMEMQMSQRGTEQRLATFLDRTAKGYDYILIDCPPTISFFTQAAALASDKYLVPLRPDPLAAIGLPLLEKWLTDYLDDAGLELESAGIVFTYVRGPLPNTMRSVMEDLRSQRAGEVFKSQVGERTSLARSVEAHLPVFLHEPTSKAAKEIIAVTNEFLVRNSGGA